MKTRFTSRAVDGAWGDQLGSARSVVTRQLGWAETPRHVAERLQSHLPAADLFAKEQQSGDPPRYRCGELHRQEWSGR